MFSAEQPADSVVFGTAIRTRNVSGISDYGHWGGDGPFLNAELPPCVTCHYLVYLLKTVIDKPFYCHG